MYHVGDKGLNRLQKVALNMREGMWLRLLEEWMRANVKKGKISWKKLKEVTKLDMTINAQGYYEEESDS